MNRTLEQLAGWLDARDGIAHREEIHQAGFTPALLRSVVQQGAATMIRRAWFTPASASPDSVLAARAGGRISCISLARLRNWWIPPGAPSNLHLHFPPGTGSPGMDAESDAVRHWVKPVVAHVRPSVHASTEDALAHIAVCLEPTVAEVLWESAAKVEKLTPEYLRSLPWTSVAARDLAGRVTGLADSGLESLLVIPLRRWGLRVQPQAYIAGRFVDALVGERLVIQVDGYEFHNSSAQRTSDIAHDAELTLRGYTVLRFSYRQIVHEWDGVARTVRQAIARGLHRAA